MANFSKVFKDLRKNAKLTQQELASKLGVSRSAIGMYENDEREPDFETLELIADFFNVDMNYLLGKSHYTTTIEPTTIAAHHDDIDWTEDELKEIEDFKNYVLSKRANK